jgi:hypothetical protein
LVTVSLTINDASATRVYNALKWLYPKPATGYTDAQWAKQCILKLLTKTTRAYEQQIVNKSQTVVQEDLSLVA